MLDKLLMIINASRGRSAFCRCARVMTSASEFALQLWGAISNIRYTNFLHFSLNIFFSTQVFKSDTDYTERPGYKSRDYFLHSNRLPTTQTWSLYLYSKTVNRLLSVNVVKRKSCSSAIIVIYNYIRYIYSFIDTIDMPLLFTNIRNRLIIIR